ncbi:hypothetical protein M422DRAFT_250820 [Sphaerobolus stellatus SS14]|uniref:G-patch domain-containing protein n=1 Tax=Sphaerobolus stellatus (strain SS14) TaxID=990650 RepID=A0A0C9VSM9_SPHS4|nr:hypothetical protein M422DRAFT_250820 [Sphaerobolus stellatus SS14]
MSSSYATNLARWNAIPMSRESPTIAGTKRSRSSTPPPVIKLEGDYDSSDEDNVSLISRSPSPTRKADDMDITTYDEHHPGAPREIITVETKIKSNNKGYALLAKLGWVEGQSLGLSGEGRVDPIPFSIKNDVTGLGKRAQDERIIESTVSQRRELDSERQVKETWEQRQSREQKAAEKEALASQIANTIKAFYCELCDKQYQTVAQYDEHCNSYAHHHKQRFKDMQTNAKGLALGQADKEARLAKERKREEKELKRMAKARGVKVGDLAGIIAPAPKVLPASSITPIAASGFKGSSWATVNAPTNVQPSEQAAPKKSGWATVNTPATTQTQTGWRTVSSNAAAAPQASAGTGFRTSGFETLATSSQGTRPIDNMEVDVNPPAAASRWARTTAPLPAISQAPPPPPSSAPPPPPPSMYSRPEPTAYPPPSSSVPPPPPPSFSHPDDRFQSGTWSDYRESHRDANDPHFNRAHEQGSQPHRPRSPPRRDRYGDRDYRRWDDRYSRR